MIRRKEIVGIRQVYRRAAISKKIIFEQCDIKVNTVATNNSENPDNDENETLDITSIGHASNSSDVDEHEPFPNNSLRVFSDNSSPLLNNINDQNPNLILRNTLRQWAVRHNVSQSALSCLLQTLHPFHPELPLDARTLLCTPVTCEKLELESGQYCHFGLTKNLKKLLSQCNISITEKDIYISFNIDGLPLFHSSNIQFWPILGLIKNLCVSPFVIGIYCGSSKPIPLELYLASFMEELLQLINNGLEHNNIKFNIKMHSFICDAPAKAFIKCIKGHGGYSACDKCTVYGEYYNGRVVKAEIGELRTDQSFVLKLDENHHTGTSPLLQLGCGMVSNFPVDYMHAVCLGVTRKLLNVWLGGKLNVRLCSRLVDSISQQLLNAKMFVPSEINRKPRSLTELSRWKATEFRTFLLYLGPVVLKDVVDVAIYEHFLLLHAGISILISLKHINKLGIHLAQKFLEIFVNHAKEIYGFEFMVYNVHVLYHLSKDVEKFGPLDNFSAFAFENYLGKLKSLIKSPKKPLEQIMRRLEEMYLVDYLPNMNIESSGLLFMEHNDGPLIKNIRVKQEFKKIKFKDYTLCIKSHIIADSYILTNDSKLVEIHNIVLTYDNSTIIIGKKCDLSQSYYRYPCESKILNIYAVNKFSEHLESCFLENIVAKCMLIPSSNRNDSVCFPLIHTIL